MDKLHIRGLRDEDIRIFALNEIAKLKTAQEDLKYLLDRGYPIKSAGMFIGNHYQLTARQLLSVVRSTSPSQSLLNRDAKRLSPEDMAGRTVNIDGFNLIIGLEVALSDGMLFAGQDGCIRDLAELRGTYRIIHHTETAIVIIRDILRELCVSKVIIMLDEPVSNSGRLKAKIYDRDWHIPVEVQIIRSPDMVLKQLPCVVTGDAIILDECESWFNMMAYIINNRDEFQTLSRLIDLH